MDFLQVLVLGGTKNIIIIDGSFLGAEVNRWPGMSQFAPLWPIHT